MLAALPLIFIATTTWKQQNARDTESAANGDEEALAKLNWSGSEWKKWKCTSKHTQREKSVTQSSQCWGSLSAWNRFQSSQKKVDSQFSNRLIPATFNYSNERNLLLVAVNEQHRWFLYTPNVLRRLSHDDFNFSSINVWWFSLIFVDVARARKFQNFQILNRESNLSKSFEFRLSLPPPLFFAAPCSVSQKNYKNIENRKEKNLIRSS